MAEKSADAFRTISEVAEWLGTPTHVLRFWESKFSQVRPVKRAGGRRYYRPGDMQLLGGIKKLLHDDGMTIKGVQKLLRENGIRYVAAMSQPLDDDLERFNEPYTPGKDSALMKDAPPPPAHAAPDPSPPSGDVLPFTARSAPAEMRSTPEPEEEPRPMDRPPAPRPPREAAPTAARSASAGEDAAASEERAETAPGPGSAEAEPARRDASTPRDDLPGFLRSGLEKADAPEDDAAAAASPAPAPKSEEDRPAASGVGDLAASPSPAPDLFSHRRDTSETADGAAPLPADEAEAAPVPRGTSAPGASTRAEPPVATPPTTPAASTPPAATPADSPVAKRRLSLMAGPQQVPDAETGDGGRASLAALLDRLATRRGPPPPREALAPLAARLAALRDRMAHADEFARDR